MKKIYINKWILGLSLILGLALTSCEEPEVVDFTFDGTADSYLSTKNANTKLFYEAAVKAGLDDLLSGSEVLTYLVPNNVTMQLALNNAGFASITEATPEFLEEFVKDHILDGDQRAASFSKGKVTNLNGKEIYVSVNRGVVFNGSATVTSANNVVTNGVVHVINDAIDEFGVSTIAEIVTGLANDADNPQFTILLKALQLTGLADVVGGSDLYTVLAPTDAAFVAAGVTFDGLDNIPVAALSEILLYHVLEGRNFTVDLNSGRYFTANGTAEEGFKGLDISVASGNSGLTIIGRSADVKTLSGSVNILATNGTVHIVDRVIFPRYYLLEALNPANAFVANVGLWTNFYNRIVSSELDIDSLFEGELVFTILPFRSANPNSTGTTEEVMLGHVFEGNYNLNSADPSVITSVNGRRYFVTEGFDGNNYVNGRTGITRYTNGNAVVNLNLYNGRVTGINGELVPLPSYSAATAIELEVETESLFGAALSYLELDSLPNVTYLHVPNAIFAEVYDEAGIAADISQLEDADAAILEEEINKYIINSVFFAVDLLGEAEYTDRNGDVVTIVDIAGGDFGIKSVNADDQIEVITFTAVNFLYSNGSIHTISTLR